jgi:cephalosporin hydroxylase
MLKLIIDEESKTLSVEDSSGTSRSMPLYTDEAFELISHMYMKVGWNQKYPYTFSWLGRPIIQLPDDMLRIQEVISEVQPDVVIETGVAHGGSLIYYSSICRALGKGRVIGIDIEIRPHNRVAIEKHEMFDRITLFEGSSTAPDIVKSVHDLVEAGESVLVILDSNHSYQHVTDELAAYASLVSVGSYIVATDGSMRDLADVPRGEPGWVTDNPANAAEEFAGEHPEFELRQPTWAFNESSLSQNITHWPSAYLKRTR